MDIFKKSLYWTGLALFAYMPFHVFLMIWLSTYTGGLDIWKLAKDLVTGLLLAALFAAVMLTRKYTKLYLLLVAFAAFYYVLHMVLFLATSQPTDTGLLGTLYNNRIVWYLLIGYSLALLFPAVKLTRPFMKVLLIASTVVCLVALLQWVLPKDIMTHFGYAVDRGVKPNFFIDDKPDLPRVFSTLRDPNSLGAFLLLPTIILGASLIKFWQTQRRMLLGGLLLLHLLIIFLTFSRSALLAIVLSFAALGALQYWQVLGRLAQRFWIPGLVALLVLAGGIFMLRDNYTVQNVVFHSDESTTLDDPNELRVKLFDKGVDGIADDPEGHGPGTAGLVSIRHPNGLLTENYYLQIGYEVGVLGLIMFIGFLALVLLRLWRNRPDFATEVLLASFAGLAFMNWLLHGWANEAVATSWFMLAGLALVKIDPKKPVRKKSKL